MNIKIFRKLFPNDKAVADFIIEHVMNNEIKCPFCGKTHKICRESTKLFHCNNCNSSFSIFKGTIFEHSRTSLVVWFYAINLMLQAKKSTSAKELERLIGVTYKTAWRINHQIRKAMSDDNFKNKFSVMVEIDETYIGGKPRAVPNKKNKRGRGTNKTPVVGVREKKSGMVYAKVMLPNENGKSLTGKQLFNFLAEACEKDTFVMSDDFKGYSRIDENPDKNFTHMSVNHSEKQYSMGFNFHTNGIESFWSNIKRAVYGVFHHISIKHMQKYIDEFCYRTNHLKYDEYATFNMLVVDAMPFSIRKHEYKNRKLSEEEKLLRFFLKFRF